MRSKKLKSSALCCHDTTFSAIVAIEKNALFQGSIRGGPAHADSAIDNEGWRFKIVVIGKGSGADGMCAARRRRLSVQAVQVWWSHTLGKLSDRLGGWLGRRAAPGGRQEPSRAALVGAWGEERAAAFLKERGFTILGRNVRPTVRDELDIVARSGDLLVFVEVKTRGSGDFSRPLRAVDARKRHALNRAAAAWLRKARYPNLFYRFDVIEVIGQPEEDAPLIRQVEDAFPFERRFIFPVR